MDDVAIWTAALSEEAISSIYHNGSPFDLRLPSEDYLDIHINELHAYYRFNDAQGVNVLDVSGNEFNGQVKNGGNSNWISGVNISGNNIGSLPASLGLPPGSGCTANSECSTYTCHGNKCQQSTFFAFCQNDSDCARKGSLVTPDETFVLAPLLEQNALRGTDCFSQSCLRRNL